MKLRRFSSPSFSLSLIPEFARGMMGRCSRSAGTHVFGLIVLLAELTLAPVGMSASVQCAFPLLNQEVIGSVRAHKQVLGSVICSDVIPVMDFFSAFEIATQDTFHHENVLVDISPLVLSRMITHAFLNVSVRPKPSYSALPPTIAVTTPAESVSVVKHHGLAPDVSAGGIGLLSERRFPSTSALTKTRRIYQNRAPKTCADNRNQSNTFRRSRWQKLEL